MSILLAEIPARDPTGGGGAGADVVLRFGSADYNHPSAPGFYPGVIQRGAALAPIFNREVMGGEESFGGAKVTLAELPVVNTGDWDWIIANNLAVDGRGPARLLLGADEATPYSQFVPILSGLVSEINAATDRLEFVFQDPLALLEEPLQAASYAGSNVPPEGLEGTEDDLKGAAKPVLYGAVRDAQLIYVNRPKDMYQAADRGPITVSAAYDMGASLGTGVTRATLALLQTTTPTAGNADRFLGSATEGAYLRLGFPASGDVTADLTEGATPADRTAARVWARILTQRCGVAAADIVEADLAALDAAAPGEVGLWSGAEGISRREALDAIAASVGAVYWVDPQGRWRIAQLTEPAQALGASNTPGEPVMTLRRIGFDSAALATDADIIALEPAPWPLPVHKLTLEWGRCYHPLSKDALADRVEELQDSREAFLSQEWRKATVEDAAVKTLHPKARTLTQQSLLVDRVRAEAEAARRLALFKVLRRCWRVSCAATPALAAAVDLMSLVRIIHPRFGLSGGKLFRVIGVAGDRATGQMTLTVWG